METALERLRAAERLHDDLLALKFDLNAGGEFDLDDFKWMVSGRLEQVVADVHDMACVFRLGIFPRLNKN